MNIEEEDKNKKDINKEEITGRPHNVNSEFNEMVSNDNRPDPTAKRNIGLGGDTEREGQKDKLQNLHIGGNETTGYGANSSKSIEAFAQGPGFEYEGSDTGMEGDVAGIRRGDQPLGAHEEEPDDADHSRI